MQITNFMSVDLEDYYCDLPISEWSKFESRIEENTHVILDLFDKYDVKATFFTLGYIGEQFPELVKEISKKGHEIASHSYSHLDLRKHTKENVEKDLVKSINILEKIVGKEIKGFRAPFFSLDQNSFWAMEIIGKYFKYDSSIFPTKTPLYGIPDAPRFQYNPSLENPIMKDKDSKLTEIPLATYKFPLVRNIPIAGGFYLRFLPYFIMKKGIEKLNSSTNRAMIYIHPKDLDKKMPKIKEYNWYYYHNLKGGLKKFERLLQDFNFSSVEKILKI
jgi:peptidoglycan-N-acetylglucosamine deacetylase